MIVKLLAEVAVRITSPIHNFKAAYASAVLDYEMNRARTDVQFNWSTRKWEKRNHE
jgi:hypothetical protein